jgi:hypothetical protein
MKYHFNIYGLGIKDKDYNGLVFGRQIDFRHKIADFKAVAKSTHFGKKRMSFAKGLREFKDLYNVDQFFCIDRTAPDWEDDSVEIWYTTKKDKSPYEK